MLGMYLSDRQVLWKRSRRLRMAAAGITPTASQLTKLGKMQSAVCRLCRRAREARGESTNDLTVETYGHINSAGYKEIATTVTAAHHHLIWRHLYASMHAAQKPKSKLKFVTLDKESNRKTLWRRQEFLRICRRKDLTEKVQELGVTIPVKPNQETRYNLNHETSFTDRFRV